jgi:hypothetical protein
MQLSTGTALHAAVLWLCCHGSLVIVCVSSEDVAAQEQSIEKPEAKDVVARVSGYVIWAKSRTDVFALALPSMKEHVVRRTVAPGADFYPTIHAISGPDRRGRIAYIEDQAFAASDKDRKHLLKTIQIDGKDDTEVLSRPGSALWATTRAGHGEIGAHLALAPTGGKVAFLNALVEKQMPKALLHEGNIEIWDVERKVKHEVTAKAIDQPLSWFPDGKRLAYVTLVSRDMLPRETLGLAEFGEYFGEKWDEVPANFVLDIENGKSSLMHIGWTPVVAFDGKSVLVGGWDKRSQFSWRQFLVEGQKSVAVKWPGDAGGAIAMPAKDVVIYRGLPTAGAPREFTKSNSLVGGPKPMVTLKVALLDLDEFQTVLPQVDSRDPVSFGRVHNRD